MKLIRFDWAMKRLLRNKADYCIVEGLLTVLLGRKITIKNLLESESNKETADDKFNRVDLLAEGEDGELMIFEIQNDRQLDYFHRMAYGTSKAIAEYMKEGMPYDKVRKVYSINIVYFSLGQGNDYAYRGTTQFVSMHDNKEVLRLSKVQQKVFNCETPADIFPEYYLLRVDKFDDVAKTPLDEWIDFLKNGQIPSTASAPGLKEARERLRIDSLSEQERRAYDYRMENLSYQASVIETGRYEGRLEGLAEGRAEGRAEGEATGRAVEKLENARNLKKNGVPTDVIAMSLGLTKEEIDKL